MPVETVNAVHQSTKLGLTSGENLHEPRGNNALSQASTASGAGYHTANVAEHYGPNSLLADSGFVTAMANLATATSADRETVKTLNEAIVNLTEQLKAKDIWAKSPEADIKRLLGAHANVTPVVPTVKRTA
jgi:hypothetical protein